MKIAIAGASGFLGSQFLAFLAAQGGDHAVTALVRRRDAAFEAAFPGVRFALCDLRNPWQIDRALAGMETVVNLSGSSAAGDEFDMLIANYHSVVNIFKSARAAGVSKIIHISSIYATVLPESAYGRSKKMADEFIRSFSGVRHVIVRPTWVVSSRPDAQLKRILTMYRFSPVALLPRTAKTKPIHAADFCKIVKHFIEDRSPENRELDVCGDVEVTLGQFYQALMKNGGKRKLTVIIPGGCIMAGSRVVRALFPFMGERIRRFEETLQCQLTERIPAINGALRILDKLESPLSISLEFRSKIKRIIQTAMLILLWIAEYALFGLKWCWWASRRIFLKGRRIFLKGRILLLKCRYQFLIAVCHVLKD